MRWIFSNRVILKSLVFERRLLVRKFEIYQEQEDLFDTTHPGTQPGRYGRMEARGASGGRCRNSPRGVQLSSAMAEV